MALCLQPSLFAWGPEGHKWIHARALERLPAELASVLRQHANYLVEHSVDPDRWRKTNFDDENPRHFVDLDNYGPFPFAELTLDYDEMMRRHGLEKMKANGLVLWTIPQVMKRLENAFRNRDEQSMLREAVALGHYVADIHQPFHAVANYDGQLSGQRGIHIRFESAVDRIVVTLKLRSGQLHQITDPLKETFDIALDSFSLADLILVPEWKIVRDLKIDRDALPRHPERKVAIYPESYFQRFTVETRAVAERRLRDAAWAVASFWTQAWRNSQQ